MPRLSKKLEEQLLQQNPELRAQGLRPHLVWVYDTDAPGFQDALRRQVEVIRSSPDSEDVLEFLDRAAEDLFSD
jgi:hypothetical protein